MPQKTEKKFLSVECLQMIVCVLLLLGLIFFPMHLRNALLKDYIKLYAELNFPVLAAIGLLFYLKNTYSGFSKQDWIMILCWGAAAGFILCADYYLTTGLTVVTLGSLIMPLFLVLYRFEPEQFQKFMRIFLIVFDVFIVILLAIGLTERLTGDVIIRTINELLNSGEYSLYVRLLDTQSVWRFYSVWGHTLTNAVLFNAFFIVNDVYFRSFNIKYPKPLFFAVSLLGVLLCSGKTAIAVLLIYLLISCWDNKKSFIWAAVIGGIAFAIGGFNELITRLQNTSLTTGRIGNFIKYIESGEYPLQLFKGYGTEFIFNEMSKYSAGFEFPILLESLHYGIICAILILAGLYAYMTYTMLKQKKAYCWLAFSLLFLQFNTYNATALENQDVFTWLCVIAMLILNCALCSPARDKKEPAFSEREGDK